MDRDFAELWFPKTLGPHLWRSATEWTYVAPAPKTLQLIFDFDLRSKIGKHLKIVKTHFLTYPYEVGPLDLAFSPPHPGSSKIVVTPLVSDASSDAGSVF